MNINNQNEASFKDIKKYYKNNINPQLHNAFNILGLSNLDYVSSKGIFIHLENGEKIYDFTSGLGVLNLGHNHPRINEIEIKCIENNTVDILKIGINKQQALLAKYLTSLLPENLNKAFFSTSGAEAVEAALKISYQVHHDQGSKKKSWIISRNQSYHGSTLQSIGASDRDILDFYQPLLHHLLLNFEGK